MPVLPAGLTGNQREDRGVTEVVQGLISLVAVLALLALACGDAAAPATTGPSAPATTVPPAPATTGPPVPATTGPPAPAGVRVAITGTLTTGPDGQVEVCKPGVTESCFGVAVAGDLAGAPLGGPGAHRLVGHYDGRTLQLTEPPQPAEVPYLRPNDFSTPCDGLRGGRDDGVIEAVQAYTATVPGSYAGSWWDQASGVFTVWFTDADPAEHEAAIAAATGGAPVCVIGGAEYTDAELRAAQDAVVDAIRADAAMAWASGDTLRNRVVVDVEQVDAELLATVTAIHPGVEVVAFVEVLDGTLADLPQPVPVRPGDVELVTGTGRGLGGMDALGSFTLRFDAGQQCFYLEEQGGSRVLAVWPLGFSADSGPPAQVFDRDGQVFASDGDAIEVGGGSGAPPGPGGDACGAASTWVMNI